MSSYTGTLPGAHMKTTTRRRISSGSQCTTFAQVKGGDRSVKIESLEAATSEFVMPNVRKILAKNADVCQNSSFDIVGVY